MSKTMFDQLTNPLKKKVRRFIRGSVAELLTHQSSEKDTPATKAALLKLYQHYRACAESGQKIALDTTGMRIFSQFEEDGILLFLLATLGIENRIFIDIGSANGINSNCANLAINLGWSGLFIDGGQTNVEVGRQFYQSHPDTCEYPPKFEHAFVSRENINHVLRAGGITGRIGFLSIDIDGNDYWVWEAIDSVTPDIVLIESHVEFGMRSIAVPYDKDHVYPGKHPQYFGASVPAMVKLGRKKGYRLVGSNRYGFNLFFVKSGLGEDLIPEVPVERILMHPRIKHEARKLESILDWDFVEI